jgi:pimeloyl-ACP methyl ester carboxylesterase
VIATKLNLTSFSTFQNKREKEKKKLDISLYLGKDNSRVEKIIISELNMNQKKQQKHFVMVHGVCVGAWSWYKVKPQLESVGHKVTAIDLAACGINTQKIEDVHTFADYAKPLLDFLASLDPNEKVILVGHSFGGVSVALAMEKFPEKIAVGIFLAAFIPDTQHKPSYVLEQVRIYYCLFD